MDKRTKNNWLVGGEVTSWWRVGWWQNFWWRDDRIPCNDSYAAGSILISTKMPRFYLKQGSSTLINLMGRVTVQLRTIRTTHTRIIHAYFAYAHMPICAHTRVYMCVYVSLLCIPPSFFMRSIVWQTKDSSGMKKREASTQNLHSVKNVNETLNISSFRLLRKFTDKLPFINNCLIFSCQNVYGCEQITGAKNYYFASSPHTDRLWLYFDSQLITKRSETSKLWDYKIEILCFARVGKSLVKLKCLSSEALRGSVTKNRTPVLFHKNRLLKRQKHSFFPCQINCVPKFLYRTAHV